MTTDKREGPVSDALRHRYREIQAPPGMAARVHAELRQRQAPPRRPWRYGVVAAAALSVVAIVVLRPGDQYPPVDAPAAVPSLSAVGVAMPDASILRPPGLAALVSPALPAPPSSPSPPAPDPAGKSAPGDTNTTGFHPILKENHDV